VINNSEDFNLTRDFFFKERDKKKIF